MDNRASEGVKVTERQGGGAWPNKTLFWRITACGALACIALFFVESLVKPPYFVKSAVKVVLFSAAMAAGLLPERWESFKSQLLQMKSVLRGRLLLLAGGVYLFIVGGYFALSAFIDPAAIRNSLAEKGGIDSGNFLAVAVYISLVNSFLEESLFRGTMFFAAKKYGSEKVAYGISALTFSLYHVAIIDGWFDIWMYGLMLLGLFVVGIFFDWLCRRFGSFGASWLVHAFANLGINTVGLIVLGVV